MRTLELDYRFTEKENSLLMDLLGSIPNNPYQDYAGHTAAIVALAESGKLPAALIDIGKYAKSKDGFEHPYIYLANCPLDEERPVFDFASPVVSKYQLKKTFVVEGFLSLLAVLSKTHSLRYAKMNNGDAFHDVFPMEEMKATRSQKSLVSLGHHQDFPIHFARPRWVHLLAVRNPEQNDVYTTFVRNKDVFSSLSASELEILATPLFHTPYDDVTKHGDREKALDDLDGISRPIKVNEMLNYYEGRTTSDDTLGLNAIAALNRAIADTTIHVKLAEGELMSIDNDRCLHGRDVQNIQDIEAHKTRWLIKSHTLRSIEHLAPHFVEGREAVLNG